MAEQKIEFRKIRDFGEILNDSFLFIKGNFKPLMQSFFAICGIFMLIQAVFNGIFQAKILGFFNDIFTARRAQNRPLSDVLNIEYFLTMLFLLLTFIAMKVAIGAYVKYYVNNNRERPGIEEVWTIFKKFFFRILIYSVPVGLLIVFGTVFCLIPGIYLWVVFVPFEMVVMMEETSFSESLVRCFNLIKENFWISFAIYIVAYLIFSFTSNIIGLVVSMVIGLAAYLTTDDIGATFGIATSFLNIFSFCFYVIYQVCVAFHYFNLVEIKDGTGILGRIDNIGNRKSNFDNIEEQY